MAESFYVHVPIYSGKLFYNPLLLAFMFNYYSKRSTSDRFDAEGEGHALAKPDSLGKPDLIQISVNLLLKDS